MTTVSEIIETETEVTETELVAYADDLALVAEVAGIEIVADSGVEGIKGEVLWRKTKARTIMNSDNNNGSRALIKSTSKKSNANTAKIERPKSKAKKSGKYTMIDCDTFIFKPSNNGVINFSYKGIFDKEMMKEAERFFEEEQKQKDGEEGDKKDGEESDKKKKKESSGKKIVVESADFISAVVSHHHQQQKKCKHDEADGLQSDIEEQTEEKLKEKSDKVTEFKEQESQQQAPAEEQKNESQGDEKLQIQEKTAEEPNSQSPQQQEQTNFNEQEIKRKISVPRRRLNRNPFIPTLPTIPEETPEELEAAERERWFFEDFCGGVLPPPEELDDWSEPAEKFKDDGNERNTDETVGDEEIEKVLRAKFEEIQKLGVKKVCDSQGNKVILMTPEAKAELLKSKLFREYVMKRKAAGKERSDNSMVVVAVDKTVIASVGGVDSQSITPPETPKTLTSEEEKEIDAEIDDEIEIVQRRKPSADSSGFKRRRI